MTQSTSSISSLLVLSPIPWLEILDVLLQRFDCTTGTIHLASEDEKTLTLATQRNIPSQLLSVIGTIPVGKGVAGISAQRREPVQICNLQTDSSGVARPAAKETKMEGSIAVPVLANGRLLAVFGIAKPVAHEFTEEEIAQLSEIAGEMGKALS